ncbi:MAG: hypothetical protein ABIJ74_03375 [archaeon]
MPKTKQNRVPAGFKTKTRINQIKSRVWGKVTNTRFLLKEKSHRQNIKKRLASKGFSFDDYFVRRTILNRTKKGFNALIKQELLNKGLIRKMPTIISRVKTFKAISDSINNFSSKLNDPRFLSNREIQKIRSTAIASEELTAAEKKEIQRKMHQLEIAIKQIAKWKSTLKEYEEIKNEMENRQATAESFNEINKKIEKAKFHLKTAKNRRRGQKLGKETRRKLTASTADRIVLEALGLRIISETEEEAYKIKNLIDSLVKKTKGRIRESRDFIQHPRKYVDVSPDSSYRSIHTLYFLGENNTPIEVHFRTWKMQQEIDEIDRLRKKKAGFSLLKPESWFNSGAQLRKKE